MRKRAYLALLLVLPLGAALALTQLGGEQPVAEAADHLDPATPMGVMQGDAEDIGDIYFWHEGGRCIGAITYGGPFMPEAGQEIICDRDLLVTFNIDDDDADTMPDHQIHARFGEDSTGACGVQFTGIPGVAAPLEGAVETELTSGTASAGAYLREDPFFFDLEGFRATLMDGTLRFMSSRDFFAGQNNNSVVVEFDCSAIGSATFQVWATTARISG
jgi:hypothetical protein